MNCTPSNTTDPSATAVTGSAGEVSAGCSSSTAAIRCTDSADMVSITYTMDSIIS